MKSYIWLQTADGSLQQVEQEVAMFCPFICHDVIQKGMGSSKNYAISLPERVSPAMFSLILDYCRFHQVPGHSNKVWHNFFISLCLVKSGIFCIQQATFFFSSGFGCIGAQVFWREVHSNGHKKALWVDIGCRQLATKTFGWSHKSCTCTNYWREISRGDTGDISFARRSYWGVWCSHIYHNLLLFYDFNIDSMVQEEKLEPLKNITDDPRIRLLNRLYAKKRKELKERERIKVIVAFLYFSCSLSYQDAFNFYF